MRTLVGGYNFLKMGICLYASHKISHAASDDFSFHFFKRVIKCQKMCSKACATRQGFFNWKYSFCPNVRKWLAIETMYRIQSNPKRHLINLAYTWSQAASWRKHLTNLHGTIFQTENKRSFIALKVNIQCILLQCFTYRFFYLLACSK